MSIINLDFPLAKAGGFLIIQQIFKHYLRNTVMVLTCDIPSTLQNLLVNMPFPDKDDNTAAYPTYLPVLVLAAWNNTTSTSTVDDEQTPQAVGYAFLAPRRKSTTGDASTMQRFLFPDYSGMHIDNSLLAMLLMLVQLECRIGVFEWVVTEANGYVQYLRHANWVRRVVAAVPIDTDASEGGEWLPRWLERKGFWEARRVGDLAVEGGKWVDTAYLWCDVPGDAGDADFSSADDSGYGDGDGDGEGSEVGSIESEGSVGSEGSAASYDSCGSEGSQGSQASQTSMSSAENDHGSDDEQEDSEEEEEDWDDDDDPYGEVEDDIEFD